MFETNESLFVDERTDEEILCRWMFISWFSNVVENDSIDFQID